MIEADLQNLVGGGLMTVSEASQFSAQSKSSLYLAMDNGVLPYVKLGRSRRIPRRALIKYLTQNLIGGWKQESPLSES